MSRMQYGTTIRAPAGPNPERSPMKRKLSLSVVAIAVGLSMLVVAGFAGSAKSASGVAGKSGKIGGKK